MPVHGPVRGMAAAHGDGAVDAPTVSPRASMTSQSSGSVEVPPSLLDGLGDIGRRIFGLAIQLFNGPGGLVDGALGLQFPIPRELPGSFLHFAACGFTPAAVSVSAMEAMRTIRELGLRHRTELSMADIAG
jgi:hypothetical protein